MLSKNVLLRQIIIKLSCSHFLIPHFSCNVLCCWQVQRQQFSSWRLNKLNPVLNRHYKLTHTERTRCTLWTFQNRSGLRTCIQFLDPLIPLTSHNQSIISRMKCNAMVLSTRRSSVSSATVFVPPGSHNPTLTSSAPLSLDPPSKVVPSISQLTQWQQPVSVPLWLVVLPNL